jgi:hypothetical protein
MHRTSLNLSLLGILPVLFVLIGLRTEPEPGPTVEPAPSGIAPAAPGNGEDRGPERGERIDEAATEGAEWLAHHLPGLSGLDLDPIDLAVMAAVGAVVLGGLGGVRSRTRPVRVSVVNGLSEEPGPTNADGIAALVRDRLARVDLQPPPTMPSADGPGQGIISVVESIESTRPVGAAARALGRASRAQGYEARLVLRRSDTTTRCGVTAELYDIDRQVALEVTTLWADSFEDAARDAAFHIAARLLADLPRGRRWCGRWLRWEPSGASLRAFEDGGRDIARRRYDQAIEHLEAGLRLDPENLSIRFRLGHTYERMQRYEEALCTYQRVVDPRYPLSRELGRTRQANLMRWRIAIILSNGHLWGEAWLQRLAGCHSETSEIDRRVRGFLRHRYSPALRSEFRSFHEAHLAGERDREQAVVMAEPCWPRFSDRVRFPWSVTTHRVGLRHDPGIDATCNAVAGVLPGIRASLDRGSSRGLLARRVLWLADGALADTGAIDPRAEDHLRAACTALSAGAFLRRAAIEEIRALGPLRRYRAGITLADIRSLIASINITGHHLAHRDDSNGYRRRQIRTVRRWSRWVGLTSRLPFTRSRLRAQTEYNTACVVAMSIGPADRHGPWSATLDDKTAFDDKTALDDKTAFGDKTAFDNKVRWVTRHLTLACTGEGNLLEQKVMAWVVHEDPDLELARRHPQFTRFAKAVLNQELDWERSRSTLAEVNVVYAIDLLRGAAAAAADRWASIDPADRDLHDLVETDGALHQAMDGLLDDPIEAASDPALRAEVRRALDRLAPGASAKLGVWPARPPAPALEWAALQRSRHEVRHHQAVEALAPSADPGLAQAYVATAATDWRQTARDYRRVGRHGTDGRSPGRRITGPVPGTAVSMQRTRFADVA